MERHLRNCGGGRSRRIEDARCQAGAAETRTGWVRRSVTEWRCQQIMKMAAFRRKWRLGRVNEQFERALFVERVPQFHRRHTMLCFDGPPADARAPAPLRR